MRRKKRPLTLIEVMIAMSLLAIILFFVLSPFKEIAILSGRLDKATENIMHYQHVNTKLTRLFSKLEDGFTLENNELRFSTAIGIDPNPALSASVEVALFVDKQHNLILEIWPKEEDRGKSQNNRKEVLCDSIDTIVWRFFQLEEGKFTTQSVWTATSPPDSLILALNGYELAFPIAKKTSGIAL